jgi:hypothetical protein
MRGGNNGYGNMPGKVPGGVGPRRPGGLPRPGTGGPAQRTPMAGGAPAGGAPKNTGIVPPRTGGAAPATPAGGRSGISLPARNGFAQRNFAEGGKVKKGAAKKAPKK